MSASRSDRADHGRAASYLDAAVAVLEAIGRPLTARECATLERIGRDRTHKDIAAEFGISINTVANLAANAYKKLGAHSAAAAVLAHRDAHPWCGSRIDFGPILERIKASRTA